MLSSFRFFVLVLDSPNGHLFELSTTRTTMFGQQRSLKHLTKVGAAAAAADESSRSAADDIERSISGDNNPINRRVDYICDRWCSQGYGDSYVNVCTSQRC